MVLEILIIERSISFALEMERMCEQIGYSVLGVVDHTIAALDLIYSRQPDIILMDIGIQEEGSSLDMVDKIKHLGIPICFFTSAGNTITYNKVIQANAAAYVVKPIEKYSLLSIINLLFQNCQKSSLLMSNLVKNQYFFHYKDGIYHKFKLSSIVYVSSMDNYCIFLLKDGENLIVRATLNAIEKDLEDNMFIRCHRRYLVNQDYVIAIDYKNKMISVERYEPIPYSRSRKENISALGIMYK